MENVIELLERLVEQDESKVLFVDELGSYTRADVFSKAKKVASYLVHRGISKEPILIRVNRKATSLIAFFGIALSGNYYIPVDIDTPLYRLDQMIESSKVDLEILVEKLDSPVEGVALNDILKTPIDEEALRFSRLSHNARDPLMLLFTSGSTGVPKGVYKSHFGFLSFCRNFARTFPFLGEERIANQAPFYFDASNKDIYMTLYLGASLYIPPKSIFALPTVTVDYLNSNKITAICWVPSSLTLIAKMKVLHFVKPADLKYVFFVGEAFLPKYLNAWLTDFPQARYFNLYGSTEVSGVCLYHEIKEPLDGGKPIPTGKALLGNDVWLEEGEIVISSPQLSLGYLNDEVKNKEVFRALPSGKRELHTGDYATIDENGDIVYLGRKDFQIKHMGYRIELQEIEVHLSALDYITGVCCLLHQAKDQIIAFVTLNKELDNPGKTIIGDVKGRLPNYMVPNKIIVLDELPLNRNGKVDRGLLKNKLEEK